MPNEFINLDDYPYDDPKELINKYRGYFTQDTLSQLQKVKALYLQLQRTKDSNLILELFRELTFNASWFEYLVKLTDWVMKYFPEPFSSSIIDLLRDGNTFEEWISPINQCMFKIKKGDKVKQVTFPAFPAPAPVLRILQNACFGGKRRQLVNASLQSMRQLQGQLYGMHLLSSSTLCLLATQ